MRRRIMISARVGLWLACLSGCVRAHDRSYAPGAVDRAVASAERGADLMRPESADPAGCARRVQATFCVDFEGADPIGPGTWSEVDDGGGKGVISLTQVALSPPHAASLQSLSAGNYNLLLRKSFAGAVTGAKAIVALRPDGDLLPMAWEMIQGNTHYFIIGGLSSSAIELHVQRFTPPTELTELAYRNTSLPTSPINVWTEVELSFESTPTRVARFRVGNVEVTADLASEVPLESPSYVVGQWNTAAGRTAVVDDVGVWLSR